jgi:hypothetical protein
MQLTLGFLTASPLPSELDVSTEVWTALGEEERSAAREALARLLVKALDEEDADE